MGLGQQAFDFGHPVESEVMFGLDTSRAGRLLGGQMVYDLEPLRTLTGLGPSL